MSDESCAKIVRHLSRIQGQIDALKNYIEENRSCEDVSHLTQSILTSFNSVRASIVEETLSRELKSNRLSPKDRERLHTVLALYKS